MSAFDAALDTGLGLLRGLQYRESDADDRKRFVVREMLIEMLARLQVEDAIRTRHRALKGSGPT